MQLFIPTLAFVSDILPGALGVAAAVVVSFVLITMVSSYYRFQHIIERAENTGPEEMGASPLDILRVQLARYLAGCARRGTSFSLAYVQVNDPTLEVQMSSPLVAAMKQAARCDDILCMRDHRTIALLMENEPEDSEVIFKRIIDAMVAAFPDAGEDAFRVGIASYPGHGLSGYLLREVATEGLAQTDPSRPIVLPEIANEEAEEEEEEETAKLSTEEDHADGEPEEDFEVNSRRQRRKRNMLDELTGVLKPSVISVYMQRLMSDLRYKRKKASLFCIGVNNMEHIARFHGEAAADNVLVGISKLLQENFRAEDLIGRHEKYAFLVLMQASLEEAEIIGKRISTLVQKTQIVSGGKKLQTSITLGVAAYPEHGRNLHTLYKAGQKVLDHSRVNDIRAYAVYDPEIHDSMPSKPMKSIKSIQA